MTRKDYVLIAQAIHDAPHEGEGASVAINMADKIATALAADNPRFDRARFMEACGFPRVAL